MNEEKIEEEIIDGGDVVDKEETTEVAEPVDNQDENQNKEE